MENYTFYPVQYADLVPLRNMQVRDLKGQEHDPIEEQIELSKPMCLFIRDLDEVIGYALIDDKDIKDIILIEFYIIYLYRKNTKHVLKKLIQNYHISHWYVNSQDSFALPLMLEKNYPYEIDALIFSADPSTSHNYELEDEEYIVMAKLNELQLVYQLVIEDGFYTGDGQEALASRINNNEIYLLRSQEMPIGVGFVSPLRRTPEYADIAMIIKRPYRKKGFASKLVSHLIDVCRTKEVFPTALTSTTNIASRKTLEKCGFYLDGYMLLAEINKIER